MAVDDIGFYGELVDVEIYIAMGMTCKEAREFARFLDDKAPAGYHSGRIAGMIRGIVDKRDRQRKLACERAKSMVGAFKRPLSMGNCPF